MNNIPLVSVVISTYNSERFFKSKLDDIIAQTIFDKLEIIIVNSGSQQNEDSIVTEYLEKYSNIKYIKTEERETIYKAWDRGIHNASGKYITNANTDDRLKNDAYEILSMFLEKNDEVAIVYADQYITRIENQNFYQAKETKCEICRFPKFDYLDLLDRCIIGSQPMWRSSLHFEKGIYFNEKYEISGDHEFYLRVAQYFRIQHLDYILGTFYKAPDRSNKCEEDIERLKRESDEISFGFVKQYIMNLSVVELKKIKGKLKLYSLLPLVVLRIIKKMDRLFVKNLYPKYLSHSIEFAYYALILIYQKLDDFKQASSLAKRYLSYKNSKRIQELFFEGNKYNEK